MISATILEAETNLSNLVEQARQGEDVVITSGQDQTPVARLVAIEPVKKRRLGILASPDFVFPADFFDPLPEEELRLWNGEGD